MINGRIFLNTQTGSKIIPVSR